jgi:hypothetical protein
LGKVDAGTTPVTVPECLIAAEVGELGQWLLVGGIFRAEPSFRNELVAAWIQARFTRDETEEAPLVNMLE